MATPHTRAAAAATMTVLSTLLLACGDGRAPNPVTPTPPQGPSTPAPSPTLFTLSGVVFEATATGNRPVEGVEVYCDPCGPPLGHSARETGADGIYSFAGVGGVATGVVELLLAKPGYVLPDQPDQSGPTGDGFMGNVRITVTGDTRRDIQIARR